MPRAEDIQQEYSVAISAQGGAAGANAGFEAFDVMAWVPDVIDVNTESGWNAPFEGFGDGVFSAGIQEVGGQIANNFGRNLPFFSGRLQSMTKAYWTGSSPIRMQLPLEFRAQTSGKLDVMSIVKKMHSLTLPMASDSDLIPPGPDRGIIVGVTIGNILTFDNVVVTQVNSQSRMILDKEGFPVKAVVLFSFMTRKIVTQQEWNGIINA